VTAGGVAAFPGDAHPAGPPSAIPELTPAPRRLHRTGGPESPLRHPPDDAPFDVGRRGIYCGAIGYVSADGTLDTSIAIRTLVYADGVLRFWAGGGIVADSVLDAEYQETYHKAAALLQLSEMFREAAPAHEHEWSMRPASYVTRSPTDAHSRPND